MREVRVRMPWKETDTAFQARGPQWRISCGHGNRVEDSGGKGERGHGEGGKRLRSDCTPVA